MIRARPGQAMVETVLAVLFVTFLFLTLFKLSYMLTGKVLLEHAALRVARARTVGLNKYMCQKAARVAVIPVAGERIWPVGDDAIDWSMELARIPDYMAAYNDSYARAILDYKGWSGLSVTPGDGRDSRVALDFSLFDDTVKFALEGNGGVEANATLYMNDQGM